jgi:hypothetical protein
LLRITVHPPSWPSQNEHSELRSKYPFSAAPLIVAAMFRRCLEERPYRPLRHRCGESRPIAPGVARKHLERGCNRRRAAIDEMVQAVPALNRS